VRKATGNGAAPKACCPDLLSAGYTIWRKFPTGGMH